MKIFGVDVAAEVAKAMPAGSMPSIVLRRFVPNSLTTGQLTRGQSPTVTTYTTRGIVEEFKKIGGATVPDFQEGDKKVLLIAKPLNDAGVEPQRKDELDVTEGASTKRYVIIDIIKRDPAGATWSLQCRG